MPRVRTTLLPSGSIAISGDLSFERGDHGRRVGLVLAKIRERVRRLLVDLAQEREHRHEIESRTESIEQEDAHAELEPNAPAEVGHKPGSC
jgi:hypothetical protein